MMGQQKRQKNYWDHLAALGMAVIVVAALSAYGASSTNLDARTQAAMIGAINDQYRESAFE